MTKTPLNLLERGLSSFLSFWYVVVNDAGRTPALDFAGFYGSSTTLVVAAYAAITVVCWVIAELVYAEQRRREG